MCISTVDGTKFVYKLQEFQGVVMQPRGLNSSAD